MWSSLHTSSNPNRSLTSYYTNDYTHSRRNRDFAETSRTTTSELLKNGFVLGLECSATSKFLHKTSRSCVNMKVEELEWHATLWGNTVSSFRPINHFTETRSVYFHSYCIECESMKRMTSFQHQQIHTITCTPWFVQHLYRGKAWTWLPPLPDTGSLQQRSTQSMATKFCPQTDTRQSMPLNTQGETSVGSPAL